MLYFKKNQPNNVVVTWTERSISDAAPFYLLVLTKIATLQTTTIAIAKSANLSQYKGRYDKFSISHLFTEEGQYNYVAYESTTASMSGVVGVVETGLAQVEIADQEYSRYQKDTIYIEYPYGIFDFTFDQTFN
jgi:hypothetical protein